MATPKRLNFSSGDGGGDSITSLQKPPSTNAEEEEEEVPIKKTKKKKKKLASPVIKRIWNEDDELSILKGLVDYRVKTRFEPNFDWDGFFDFVQGSIHVKFSKEQLFSKIRKLRRKFIVHMERINQGKDPLFTRCSDSQVFGYSSMIWGQNDDQVSAKESMEKPQEETQSRDDEQMDYAEPVNDNGSEKSMFDDKTIENRTAGEKAEFANGEGMEKAKQTESAENEQMDNAEPVNDNGYEKSMLNDKTIENRTAREEAEFANRGGMEKAMQTEGAEDEQMEDAEPVNDNGSEKSIFDDKTIEYMTAGEEAEFANGGGMERAMQIDSAEDAFKENEQVGNDEPVNENGGTEGKFDGISLHEVGVDKTTEYKTDGKESHEDDDDDDGVDELLNVQDAFEATISQGLSGCQKRLQLKKLMNLGKIKRKELSNEWKALRSEEVKLNIKKLRFSAKLVEAANDE